MLVERHTFRRDAVVAERCEKSQRRLVDDRDAILRQRNDGLGQVYLLVEVNRLDGASPGETVGRRRDAVCQSEVGR